MKITSPLYSNLTEYFENHDGSLQGYVGANLSDPVTPQQHYNLRGFATTNTTVPWNMTDMELWNVYHFQYTTIQTLGNRRPIGNASYRARTQSELDILRQSDLDVLSQQEIDFLLLSAGNEEWPATDPDVTVGKSVDYAWSNAIFINLTNGVTKTVTSHYFDDLLTDFTDADYFIEMLFRALPAQTDPAHLDLVNSYIDFSSSPNFDAALTDSVALSESILPLDSGGDSIFRITRSRLRKSNLADLRAIQFRLLSVGNMTVKAQALRMFPANYATTGVVVNTKKQNLQRDLPRNGMEPTSLGSNGSSNSASNAIFFEDTHPKNITQVIRFNSGHLPTGNDNALRLLYRRNPDTNSHILVKLFSRDTQSRLRIYQVINGVETEIFSTPILTNILTPETDYYLQVVVRDQTVSASIYTENGPFLGTQLYTTGNQTVTLVERGGVGYQLMPLNYDFTLQYIGTQSATFARFESTNFTSITPVIGATLIPNSSAPVNMIRDADILENGDATLTQVGDIRTIERDGSEWFGGIKTSPIVMGDSSQLYLKGSIYPVSVARGNFVAAFLDGNESVQWIKSLSDILPNQWNDFKLRIPASLVPTQMSLWIHQNGFYPDTFRLRNVMLCHNTVSWYGSSDAGTNWQPFKDAVGNCTGARFVAPGMLLRVRALAFSDTGWIQGYEVIPKYQYTGH